MSKFLSLLESHPWSNLIAQSTKSLASTNQINNQEVMEYSVTALIIFSLLGLLLKKWTKKKNLRSKKKYQNWNIELLNALEWKRFEEVIARYYELIGYRSEVTRTGADGGVDVILYQQGVETPAIIIQCKSWSRKVGVKAIRELYGVMAGEGIEYGVFATTSGYTQEAIDWADGKRLQLMNGEDFVTAFNQLPEDQKIQLLKFATSGEYTTPSCPSCDTKMIQRTASKGKSAGSEFWGCTNYPRCKQTFKMI